MHPLPQGLKDCRQAHFCRGRPAVGAGLDETAAEPHTAHKWLDGVSDALTDFLRRLRETYPSATAKIRPGPTPTADYRPSRRSPWPAAIDLNHLTSHPDYPTDHKTFLTFSHNPVLIYICASGDSIILSIAGSVFMSVEAQVARTTSLCLLVTLINGGY